MNLCMADNYNEFNKPMLIKQTPVSDFIVWVWRLKQKGLSWLRKTKASTPGMTKPE